MARRKNGAAALEDIRQLLADTTRQIEGVRLLRSEELTGTADDTALDKLDAEIKRLETLAARHCERIALLEEEKKQAAAERQAREKEGLIQRIEKKTRDERQAAAIEIRDGIAQADAGLRKLIDIGRDVQAAWPWQAGELAPCLLGPSPIVAAVTHEIYRIGARPLLYGGQDKPGAGINFPGGKPARLELAGLPEKIKPLSDVIAEASELASKIMRGKATVAAAPIVTPIDDTPTPTNTVQPQTRSAAEILVDVQIEADARDRAMSSNTVAPSNGKAPHNDAEPRERTAAEIELAALLNRQNALSQDISPEGEAKYHAVCAEIVRVSQQVETERMEKAHD